MTISSDAAFSAAVAVLARRVDTARAALDEATAAADTAIGRDVAADVVAELRVVRHRAWARLTEAGECLAAVQAEQRRRA